MLRDTQRELSRVRAEQSAYEAQLNQRAEELSRMRSLLATYQTQLGQQTAGLSEVREQFSRYEAALSDLRSQLQQKTEALDWIQTSRSWRIASSLRNLQWWGHQLHLFGHRFRQSLHLPSEAIFQGAIDSPLEGSTVSQYLEVRGWVFSTAAPVVRVEAFLDGNYLGILRYGVERADVAEAYPLHGQSACGYAERFCLDGSGTGRKKLTIRVFDQQSHVQLYYCSIIADLLMNQTTAH